MIILFIIILIIYLLYNKFNVSNPIRNQITPISSNISSITGKIQSKCTLPLSLTNVCKSSVVVISLPNGGTCLDFTGMYPGVPLDDPNFGNVYYSLPNNGNYVVYNTTTGNPDLLDVSQSLLGDCVFDSTVALIAYKKYDIIKNMIFQGDDNIYYVQFYYKNMPLLIKITCEMPLGSINEGAFDLYILDPASQLPILWSHIILKAFACAIGYYSDFPSYYSDIYDSLQGYTAMNSGIDGVGLLNAITNQKSMYAYEYFNEYYNKFNDSTWLFIAGSHQISFLTTSKIPVRISWNNWTIFIVPGQGFVFYDSKNIIQASIIASHGYSVLGYDSINQTINLRNPWGTYCIISGYYYLNGIMTVPISIFEYIYQILFYVQI